MKKRIFGNLFWIAAVTAVLVLAASVLILYNFFSGRLKQEMAAIGASVAAGLDRVSEKTEYLTSLAGTTGGKRLTLIGPDGTVLYDSAADVEKMENHADRQEVIDAFRLGKGESTRFSKTLDEQTHYYALRLDDGSVIRVADTQRSIFGIYLQLLSFMALLTAGILILAAYLANRMTEGIIRPINLLDPENPDPEKVYDELAPLLKKLKAQKTRIEAQIETIRRQRAEQESLTEDMQEGLIVLDKNASILSVNKSAAEIIGARNAKSCIGKNIWHLTRNLSIQNAAKAALSGEKAERDFDSDSHRYSLRANPVFEGDAVKGATLMLLDVSEKHEAEQMRREFSANVSHELKTPLTSIKGYAEMLQNGLVKPKDVPSVSGRIVSETDRLISLVNDIIRLSGLDEDSIDPVFETIRLKNTASDVIERLKAKAERLGVSLSLDAEDIVISGVPVLIDELIFNLADNAVTYNREGGSVSVRVYNTNGRGVLEVSDTGIGIPQKFRERVFERFFRVDKSRSKSTGGTGLGLSIVKHIAKLHRAAVELESRPGTGTTVTVMFGG